MCFCVCVQEINEQKSVLLKNHHLLEHHLNSTYVLKQRHANIVQKYKLFLLMYRLLLICEAIKLENYLLFEGTNKNIWRRRLTRK